MIKILALFISSAMLSPPGCGFFQHPGPAVSCLESLGAGVLKQAIDIIYTTIDNGTEANWTEARIISALESAAIGIAPEVWKCAMLFVSNPQAGKPPAGIDGPKKATKSAAAAIAADYLAAHKGK